MIPAPERVRPPAGETEGQKINGGARSVRHTLPLDTDHAVIAAPVAAAIGWVVLTTSTDPDPKQRRRVFLSLHSATKAVKRAEAKGYGADLLLCALVPVGGEVL